MSEEVREKRKRIDRRSQTITYDKRTRNRREGEYYYDRTVYLTDTNFFQNAYFAQYFDFIGEAREDFLMYVLGDQFEEFMGTGISISTVDTSIQYKMPLYLFDKIRIFVTVSKFSRARVYLNFKIEHHDGRLIANSKMTIAFTLNGKVLPVPDLIKQKIQENIYE